MTVAAAVHNPRRENTMITLIQYPGAFGLVSASPFCTKAEALLRVSGVPFEVALWTDPRKAPKQKLPIIRDNDRVIADSTFIRKHLETHYGVDFDAELSPAERAVAKAFTLLCEEHLYWAIVYSRWMEEDNWPQLRDAYFGELPALLRPFITRSLRNQAGAQLRAHGMGRHSRDEIYQLASDDLSALAQQLGERPFFMGEHHTGVDATVYAFVAGLLHCTLQNPARQAAKAHPNLVAYCDRLRRYYFDEQPKPAVDAA